MTGPRVVRIPRTSSRQRVVKTPALDPPRARRVNHAGTQRAIRIAVLYVGAVLVLTLALALLDLRSAEASRPAVQQGLDLFLAVAFLLVVGSVIFTLSPAPRYATLGSGGTVVVGRWGTRREFPPSGLLDVRVVKQYPAGFLSSEPVDIVQLVDLGGRRRSYQVESGLFNSADSAAAPD